MTVIAPIFKILVLAPQPLCDAELHENLTNRLLADARSLASGRGLHGRIFFLFHKERLH